MFCSDTLYCAIYLYFSVGQRIQHGNGNVHVSYVGNIKLCFFLILLAECKSHLLPIYQDIKYISKISHIFTKISDIFTKISDIFTKISGTKMCQLNSLYLTTDHDVYTALLLRAVYSWLDYNSYTDNDVA